MTSFSVQKRAKPQPTQAVCRSRKNLAALGVDFKILSTLVSEISKSSVHDGYRIPFLSSIVFALEQTGFAKSS